MRYVTDELVTKWNDDSINKRAKSEAILKFHRELGYADNSNVFRRLMAKLDEPTPVQNEVLTRIVGEYWNFYNPEPQPAS